MLYMCLFVCLCLCVCFGIGVLVCIWMTKQRTRRMCEPLQMSSVHVYRAGRLGPHLVLTWEKLVNTSHEQDMDVN